MTEKTVDTDAKPKRARSRKVRIEEDPRVVEWCKAFTYRTQENHGFTPTPDQAIEAYLEAASRALDSAEEMDR